MRIAIFANIHRSVILSHIQLIFKFFEQTDSVFILEEALYKYIRENADCCPERTEIIKNNSFNADIALSIGGDGTFLNTAACVGQKDIPVLGINTGRLGFLADVATENIIPALEALIKGDYYTEERSLLQVETSDGAVAI